MQKILTAMSGGVDSAAACLLLQRQGYTVGGATMLLRSGGEAEARDARRSADQLGLPFYLFSFREEFEQNVIRPFAVSYRQGQTPNPCIFCNKTMKFGLFLQQALELGYDGMATGHYARIRADRGSGRYLLLTAADPAKDQTYMLSVLTQQQLARTVLPLGDYTKQEVRALAQEAGLSIAHKHDSQDICFVPDGDYMAYLRSRGFVPQPGHFRGTDGTDYGPHEGMEAYTIGQRRGLGLAFGSRMYVVGKQGADVILGTAEQLYTDTVLVEDMNWIPFARLTASLRAQAKLRYTTRTAPCTVTPVEGGCLLRFDQPQRAPTPGQTAVLYDAEVVLGGGTIQQMPAKAP